MWSLVHITVAPLTPRLFPTGSLSSLPVPGMAFLPVSLSNIARPDVQSQPQLFAADSGSLQDLVCC